MGLKNTIVTRSSNAEINDNLNLCSMKLFKYLAALVHKHIWRKTQKRSDVRKNDSDITVIAVGNGGYNIAYI